MATDCGVTDFMSEQDTLAAKKYDLRRLEEQSNKVNEAYDILKTPTGTQQNQFFRNKKVLLSGSSDYLKSREFKSSKSKNPELLKRETMEEDASNISMMSVTTNVNEQPINVNYTDQLEQNVKQL